MKKYLCLALIAAVLSTIAYPMLTKTVYAKPTFIDGVRTLPMDNDTLSYWNQARYYKAQNRLELSRQTYLVALANCNNTVHMYEIKRELQAINLQIKSLR